MAAFPVDPIQYLLRRNFPLYGAILQPPSLSAVNFIPLDERHRIAAEVKAYREKLEAMPIEELLALVDAEETKERNEVRAKADRDEQQRFFSQSNAAADFDHWSKAAYWSIDEAVALSFGKAPERVKWETVKGYVQVSPFASQYARRRDLALRAIGVKQLYDPVLPGFFLSWAKRSQIPCPSELEAQVTVHGHTIADWKSLYDQLKEKFDRYVETTNADSNEKTTTIEALTAERDELRQRSAETPQAATATDKPLLTRERETALKLIIGMAVGGYGHDPKATRSSATKEIADDLATRGIGLDPDTVRKWLKEASELLPPEE